LAQPPEPTMLKAATAQPAIELLAVTTPEQLAQVQSLFREYAADLAALGVSLCFQNFDAEVSALPGVYAQPAGAVLLARVNGAAAGCVALRALPEADHVNACEMKRLFVRPAFRRYGLGRALTLRVMDMATQAGYSCLLLDTLHDMEAARELYASLGFAEVAPYYYNPIAGAHYLKVELTAATRY
jgi:putative acetyltransferase